ncbi:MAG: MnhB domain-containing protein [Alphaproteobacteria bacterium]
MADWSVRVLGWLLFCLIGWALLDLPVTPKGLTASALDSLTRSGVENPVTAALLNYRSYDTLLEVGVFLLAAVGVWSVRQSDFEAIHRPATPTLLSLLRLVLPILIIAGGYLLWVGATAPGGAFQGGAVLGGGAVLALLAGTAGYLLHRSGWLRLGLAIGSLVFTGVTAGLTLASGVMLGYPAGAAALWMLVIEAAALVSIALTLGSLYYGGRPVGRKPDERV